VVMKRSFYRTTLMDARYRYVTELMIVIYREVSVDPLIYLDKRLFWVMLLNGALEGTG